MPKAIMVLADGRSYTSVDGCRILLCPDNVQDQQIQQVLQQLQQGNMQAIHSGQFAVGTRFAETANQQAWQQVQGATQQNQPVAVIDQQSFLVATRLDPSALSQTQGSQQVGSQQNPYQQQQNPFQQSGQIQGQGYAQSSQSSQQQKPQW